jgi:hypothetical protein
MSNVGWLMKDELKRMWKESFVACFKALSLCFSEWVKQIDGKLPSWVSVFAAENRTKISRMHVGSHSFLSLLARLMALWYWKLNVGSSRETYKLEYRNYVKHVRTLAEDYHIVALFQLSPTRLWCMGYGFKFRYILAFYACSGNMW